MADSEVFVEDTHELVEVKKKGRKPMSEERKKELVARLKEGKAKKKALREAGKVPPKEPKVKEVLPATETEPAVYVKNVRKTKPTKDHTDDIADLKAQIAELKANKTSKEDLAEIKLLKEEMKEMKAAAVEYRKQQKEKAKAVEQAKAVESPKEIRVTTKKAKNEPKKVTIQVPTEATHEPPKPRYSTYQKSIWSQFT